MDKFLNYFSKEYLDDILIRLSHHSTAIEGNTISLPETISIILYNKVSGDFDLREIYEIKNHEDAFNYILDEINNHRDVSLNTLKLIHLLLMNKLAYDRGEFKEYENMIIGADFLPAKPSEVPSLLQQLIDNTKYRLHHTNDLEEKLEIILDNHIQFERIHPFSDGNGRVGRILLNYYLLSNNFPPLIIEKSDKSNYIELLNNQNLEGFKQYALEKLEIERNRMNKFSNKERQSIKTTNKEKPNEEA